MVCNVLSYIRDNVTLYQSKSWSFDSLQMLASDVEYGFMFLKAFFTQDMSEIENDERFIGLFYKEPEPTGNDVPDNLEVNSFLLNYILKEQAYVVKTQANCDRSR